MDSKFSNIEIIKYLREKNSPFYSKIEELYNLVQAVLSSVPKLFSNYTLHDINHCVRVIEYMNEFVKPNISEYSDLQLALIVYAGLLHDLGMTVSDDEEKSLYKKFEDSIPNFNNYSCEEKKEFLKNHIRENHGNRIYSKFDLEINSSAKIKSYLFIGDTNSIDISKLVGDICKSHTENYKWIIENIPSEKHIADYEINPQHIAVLLRIGDALDIDDRRAPLILFDFLKPLGISESEWKKHKPITNYKKIEFKENKYEIIFEGECSDYNIYLKLHEYVNWINEDIENLNPILNNFKRPYKFEFKTPIEFKVTPIGFKAEPIKFNLKYEKVVKLLMGEKIYGSKKDGLRELIQNAIDAVLLFNNINKKDNTVTYNPEVGIKLDKSKNEFIAYDNGTGMSEEILKKYFFNIGNSYYISDDFKKQLCKYNPIGHFGIGFLACFMLSSRIELKTKYYNSNETISLSFEKNSPYITWLTSNDPLLEHGTHIILQYDQIIPCIFENEEDLINYIKELIISNDYKFYIIDSNNKKTDIKIDSEPKIIRKIGNGQLMFDYKLKTFPSVKFDIFKYFKDNKYVYFVKDQIFDDDIYINLDYFKMSIEELDKELQENNKIGNFQHLVNQYSEVFQDIVEKHRIEITNCFNTYNSTYRYFSEYFNQFIENSTFSWFDIPIVLNKNVFNRFLKSVEENGYDRALYEYNDDVKFLSIFGTNLLDDKLILKIVNNFVDLNDLDLDVDYYFSYPLEPIEKNINLLRFKDSNNFINVKTDYQLNHCSNYKLFLKGIRVNDRNLVLPHTILKTQFERICVNVDSNEFDTDVSRNNFDKESRMRLAKYITKFIYEDLINSNQLSNEENNMIKSFIDKYYD